jgi:antitoxin ParD1/3/4
MTVSLKAEQVKWLEQQVAAGRFESLDEALELAVATLMSIEGDDLEWAKPLVEEARASLARGQGISAEAMKAELDAYLKSVGAR